MEYAFIRKFPSFANSHSLKNLQRWWFFSEKQSFWTIDDFAFSQSRREFANKCIFHLHRIEVLKSLTLYFKKQKVQPQLLLLFSSFKTTSRRWKGNMQTSANSLRLQILLHSKTCKDDGFWVKSKVFERLMTLHSAKTEGNLQMFAYSLFTVSRS